MGPSDMGQVIALASLALALVTVAMTARRYRVVDMPNAPPEGEPPPVARCVGRQSDEEPRIYY